MRVLVNVDPLRPPLTGIGRYTRELLYGLRQHQAIDEVIAFAYGVPVKLERTTPSNLETSTTGSTVQRIKATARRISGSHALYAHWRDLRFRHWTGPYQRAVYHEPNYLLCPFSGPCVASIHDLSYLHYPDYHPRQRVRLMESRLPRTLERADRILTLSEFVKHELVSMLGINPQRITITPLAAAEHFRPYSSTRTQAVLHRHDLVHGHYLLSVATLEPRKNLLALIDSYRALDPALRRHYPLVLVGTLGWQLRLFQEQLRQHLRSGEIRLLGYISETELPLLYAGARGFACTSVYEGFGLPPLEAMACGIPVLSSNRSSLPEVVGDAGLLVDPDDHKQLTSALEQLLTDDTLREHNRERGLARARQFSWTRFIDTVVAVYQQLQ